MPLPNTLKRGTFRRAPMKTTTDYRVCAARLRALADPDRLRIVNCLLNGPQTVGELARRTGSSIFKASHHLKVLRRAQLVTCHKQGKFVEYSLSPEVATCRLRDDRTKTLDLGACQLNLLQA